MKKFILTLLILSMLMGLVACKPKEKDELQLGFVPLVDQDKLEDLTEPLTNILTDKLGKKVSMFTSTNYVGVVEALGSGKVDFAIIPPFAYVLANKNGGAEVLLSALNKDGKNYYRSELLVRKDSGIKEAYDKDGYEALKGKKVAFVDPESASGYIYPGAMLVKGGLDLEKDVEYMFAGGHDKAVQMLLNGDVDVCATYEGAEKKLMKDFDGLEGLEVLEYTEKIPYVCVAASKDLSDDMKQKIKEVFQNDLSSGEGKEACEKIFNLTGFVEASNDDFQNVIDTAKIMNVDLEK